MMGDSTTWLSFVHPRVLLVVEGTWYALCLCGFRSLGLCQWNFLNGTLMLACFPFPMRDRLHGESNRR